MHNEIVRLFGNLFLTIGMQAVGDEGGAVGYNGGTYHLYAHSGRSYGLMDYVINRRGKVVRLDEPALLEFINTQALGHTFRRVELSTNPALNLPQFPKSFLNAFETQPDDGYYSHMLVKIKDLVGEQLDDINLTQLDLQEGEVATVALEPWTSVSIDTLVEYMSRALVEVPRENQYPLHNPRQVALDKIAQIQKNSHLFS